VIAAPVTALLTIFVVVTELSSGAKFPDKKELLLIV
jgi:hypothetical protein